MYIISGCVSKCCDDEKNIQEEIITNQILGYCYQTVYNHSCRPDFLIWCDIRLFNGLQSYIRRLLIIHKLVVFHFLVAKLLFNFKWKKHFQFHKTYICIYWKFLPPMKLTVTPRYNWNSVNSGVKHHNTIQNLRDIWLNIT